ncbi:MAG TPA: aminodeoxychorismate synthase component I [Solirubrobacterales bacterium]
MKTLLIDNYDSFTYNLFQLLGEVNGVEPIVVRNDEVSWAELEELPFDNVVISPGPGRPERPRDFGVCAEVIRRSELPLLGVCLGHQGLATVCGGAVSAAPEPMHGRLGTVVHDGSALFAGIPREFEAVRYHSLCVDEPLPEELEAVAWGEDGVVMALRHRARPHWGVQFHPESVCAEHGRRLVENFRDLSVGALGGASLGCGGRPGHPLQNGRPEAALECFGEGARAASTVRFVFERIDAEIDSEAAFVALYGNSASAFWLDSSGGEGERARFSFMGDASGPLGAQISYDVEPREVRVEREGDVELRGESIFDYLERELESLRLPETGLPFEFACGFVGYFGYELKAECGGEAAHSSPYPDAAFVFADRLIAFDRVERCAYLVCLVEAGGEEQAERWIEATRGRLVSLPAVEELDVYDELGSSNFELARDRERYLVDIEECRRLLAEGESYEVCLTSRVRGEVDVDPLALYRRLRRVNPAPFSAFLRFGELAVLSSSPERFLRVGRDGEVEARPIKGTSRRGETPDEDALLAEKLRCDGKSRAENLMIADLLRNDLGSVCEVGSVRVPRLMEVEGYETVHQLVTTVRGRLRPELEALDCVRACFPPGSMTGAPKRRTMAILDRLEGEARGLYSGAFGYLGLGGGCDLGVAIRTIVVEGGTATIGAGGAIVAQSDSNAEYEEMLLKVRAPLRALDPSARLAALRGSAVA